MSLATCHGDPRAALQTASTEWVLVLKSTDRIAPAGHVSTARSKAFMPPLNCVLSSVEAEALRWHDVVVDVGSTTLDAALENAPEDVAVVCCPYFWVEDDAGEVARVLTREAWVARRNAKVEVTQLGFKALEGKMLVLPAVPFLRRIG